MRLPIAVVGGGIAGLSAAWELHRGGHEFALFEAGERPGGVIASEERDGFTLELGPDSFLTQKPGAAELCGELGLGDRLMPALAAGGTRLWRGGELVALPRGWTMLAPGELWPVVTTRLFSPATKARIAWRWLRAAPPARHGEETVAEFARRHFGPELTPAVAAPLLAGVYGGDARQLSAREVAPQMVALEAKGNLVRQLSRQARGRRNGKSMFTTLAGGMGALPAALAAALPADSVRCRAKIVRLATTPAGYRLESAAGGAWEARGVILALPAWAAAALLEPLAAEAATALDAIPYRGAVTMNLAYTAYAGPALPPGYGFLAGPEQDLAMLACTFAHQKFGARAPAGGALLRVFFPEAALAWSDTRLEQTARAELQRALGVFAAPDFTRIARWPRAMAQYTVGHAARLAALRQAMARHPQLRLAGNAYGGIGIPDCIAGGRQAARALMSDGSG